MFPNMITPIKQKIINIRINGRSSRNKYKTYQTYYFFDDMIDIKNLHLNLLKIDKKLHKDIDVYYIGFSTIKKFSDSENIA